MVLLVRPDHNGPEAVALAAHGITPVIEPFLDVTSIDDPGVAEHLADALAQLDRDDWVALTSARTLPAWRALDQRVDDVLVCALSRGVKLAAVGPTTAQTLTPATVPALIGDGSGARALLAQLLTAAQGRPRAALLPGSDLASRTLPEGLRSAGWSVTAIAAYRIAPVTATPAASAALRTGQIDAVLLRSPSAVRAVAGHCVLAPGTVVFGVGESTAHAARQEGWSVHALHPADPQAIAVEVAYHLHNDQWSRKA